MSTSDGAVQRAIGRWEKKGLLPPDLAGSLRAEVEAEDAGEARRWSQYALAATGAAVLLIAGGTFLTWAWPEMGYGGQSLTLGLIGLLTVAFGIGIHGRRRWGPVAYLLQLVGPFLIVMALAYSENAWPDQSLGGVLAGVIGVLLPVILVGGCLRRDPVMAALQVVPAFLFLFLFMDRALGLSAETCLWILDGVLVLGLAVTAVRMRAPESPDWTLNLFTAFLYTTPALVGFTGEVMWQLDELLFLPLDVWLLAVVALTLWAMREEAPVHLRRGWYHRQLAYCVLMAIPLAFGTTLETLDAGPDTAAPTVAAVGGLGLWFALARGSRPVLLASCLTILLAAWYYGAEKAGAMGAVVALGLTAVVLFWGSSRVGARPGEDGVASS